MNNLVVLLQIAGLLHLCLICAGALMPRAVGLGGHIAGLPPFVRALFWTYYSFIGLSIVSFGLITFFHAEALAAGTPLARAVCFFLTAFWGLRLIVATFYFDLRPYLTDRFRKAGYYFLNVVFAYLLGVYAWAGFWR